MADTYYLCLLLPLIAYLIGAIISVIVNKSQSVLKFFPDFVNGRKTKSNWFLLGMSLSTTQIGLYTFFAFSFSTVYLYSFVSFFGVLLISIINTLCLYYLAPYIFSKFPETKFGIADICFKNSIVFKSLFITLSVFIPFITYFNELSWMIFNISAAEQVNRRLMIPLTGIFIWLYTILVGFRRQSLFDLFAYISILASAIYALSHGFYISDPDHIPDWPVPASWYGTFTLIIAFAAFYICDPATWQVLSTASDNKVIKKAIVCSGVANFIIMLLAATVGTYTSGIIMFIEISYATFYSYNNGALYVYLTLFTVAFINVAYTRNVTLATFYYNYFKPTKNYFEFSLIALTFSTIFVVLLSLFSAIAPLNTLLAIGSVFCAILPPGLLGLSNKISEASTMAGVIFGLVSIGVPAFLFEPSISGIIDGYIHNYVIGTMAGFWTTFTPLLTSTIITLLFSVIGYFVNKQNPTEIPLIKTYENQQFNKEPVANIVVE